MVSASRIGNPLIDSLLVLLILGPSWQEDNDSSLLRHISATKYCTSSLINGNHCTQKQCGSKVISLVLSLEEFDMKRQDSDMAKMRAIDDQSIERRYRSAKVLMVSRRSTGYPTKRNKMGE